MRRNTQNRLLGAGQLSRTAATVLLSLGGALLLQWSWGFPRNAEAVLSSTITTCDGCHGNPPVDNAARVGGITGQFPGSHGMHQNACSTCHVAPGSTQFNHANGSIDMASPINGATGAGYSKGTSFTVSNAAFSGGTCSGINCHGAGTPTWGSNTTKTDCEKCHGSAATNPFYDTAGNTANTTAKAGAHTAHLLETSAGKNIASNVPCATCHTVPATLNATGHFDSYPAAEVAITGALATKNSTLAPVYNQSTGKCTNVYCHGAGLTGSGGTDYSPTWNTPLLTGNTSSTGDCSKCHQYLPPPQSGSAGSAHSGVTAATQCKDCHTHVNSTGTGFVNPALHINGTVEGGTCVSCHSTVQNTYRRQVAGTGGDIDNGMASHHIKYTSLSTNDCGICHDQTNHKTYSNGVSVYLKNLDGGASVLYDGTATNDGEAACVSCHDANGASSLGANALKPFTASGDNNAPVNIGWTAGAMAHSVQMGCFNCHGKSAAANTTLDPKYNGHGSPTAKLLQYSYTAGSEQTFCYNCHGTPVANGAVDDIKTVFSKVGTHNITVGTIDGNNCANCHNKHQAKGGTSAIDNGTNIASTKLYGATAVTTTTWSTTLWGTGATWTSGALDGGATYKYEWQLCFNCHKSSLSANSTALEAEFNPNNTNSTTLASQGSYHPVIQLNPKHTVTTGWQTAWASGNTKTMHCSDCHTDSAAGPKGPHGSATAGILRGAYDSTGTLCKVCHNLSTSGFMSGTTNLHTTRHNSYACKQCHVAVPHGSKVPHLMRWPGMPAIYDGSGTSSALAKGSNTGVKTWRTGGSYSQGDCDHTGF